MPTQLLYEHIGTRSDGAVIIMPSGFKVRMLIQAYLSGSSIEDLQEDFPFLTFGQIHSALAYYWDHKASVDAEIAHKQALAQQILGDLPTQLSRSELHKRLESR